MLGSVNNLSRGIATLSADMQPLPQFLPLDPIILGNKKYTRSGELRRVLGVPLGSSSDDLSLGLAQSKPFLPVATEELKNFKESVQDASKKARDRAKKLHDSIFKLDKYREALGSKKRQRCDILSSERSGGPNLTKIGSQIRRNPHGILTQRSDDKTKSVGLNKRIRTSVADMRQIVTEKEGDMLPTVTSSSVRIEEKIRRLPVGGEGWDSKMKRKRSVGAVNNRVLNGDRDIKRAMLPKLSADSTLQSCDAKDFRLKSSPGVGVINKFNVTFEPAGSDSSLVLKNGLESTPLPGDCTTVLEQRIMEKGNKKSNIRDGNPASCSSTLLKAKVSRAPRTGSIMVLDSFSRDLPLSGVFQGWEEPSSVNKVPMSGVANNQKHPISMGSSSHAIAQWVGQRPHKNSRTRRTNLVYPVNKHVEAQVTSPGFATSDFNSRTPPFKSNGSLLTSTTENNIPKIKRKLENVSSPIGLSESEESGAGENKVKEKGIDSGEMALNATHKAGAFALPIRKNRVPTNETGYGVRRQGRSGSGSYITRPGIHPLREKSENLPTTKPFQTVRHASDKGKSKSGRPPYKKLKDRMGSNYVALMVNGGLSDFTGEFDDDHEELFVAANSARNAGNIACSGPFWKKMESIFASHSSDDMSYLKKQISFAEELDESLSQMFSFKYNVSGGVLHKVAHDCSVKRQGGDSNKESIKADTLCGRFDRGRLDKVTPLYQRVLSALIEEDESEEFYHHSVGKNMPLHYASDDSHCGSCNLIDIESKDIDRMESEVESNADFQTLMICSMDRLSGDKGAASNTFRNPTWSNSLHSVEQWLEEDLLHSDGVVVSEICSNDLFQLQPRDMNAHGFSSSNSQYQLMSLDDRLLLELQSIGLYPETLPELAEGEEVINQDVFELKERLYQQIVKKKNYLEKIDKAIQKVRVVEERKMEYVAMDQLIEMAYKKQMANRGGHASKSAVRKVSRQVALAFIKRTLARCQKLEETGSSCFTEAALQDVMFSVLPCSNDAKSLDCVGSGTASNTCNEASNHQIEAKGSGAVSSPSERFDSHSDYLDRGYSDALHAVHSSKHYTKHASVLNKVKREVLIEDVVGSASSRVTSTIDDTVLGGVRGRKYGRERDENRHVRKTKPKAKQKNIQLSTSGNGLHGWDSEAIQSASAVCGSSQPIVNPSNRTDIQRDSSNEADEPIDYVKLQLHELDLGVSDDLGGPQDLSTWLNFEEDGLQDHDSIGLEIPMDDLKDLAMLL
ncbi:hypothetical protein CFOL_v3_10133 [Cephalotus follicularis]|uniref:Uncharacterized protein n=1 Tax=Cephalotus follicularis TaxID=3775 RepID=A0A1Q3BFR4_CEPFO|nr:hypothetical protein CFOL_v3_10133 [Cephalotus follicularis]